METSLEELELSNSRSTTQARNSNQKDPATGTTSDTSAAPRRGSSSATPGCVFVFFNNYIDGRDSQKPPTALQRICQNRWCRTACYFITALFCAAPYYNWHFFQNFLTANGSFASVDEATPVSYIANGSEFVVGAIAGAVLDHLGPRACGMTGMALFLTSILLLMYSTMRHVAVTYMAMVLVAASTNLVAFPGLIVGDFFPNHSTLAVGIVIAAQTGCSIVAPILWAIWQALGENADMFYVFGGYFLFIGVPCTIAYFFFLPCERSFPEANSLDQDEKEPLKAPQRQGTETLPTVVQETSSEILAGQQEPNELHAQTSATSAPKSPTKATWKSFWREMETWEVHIFTIVYVCLLIEYTCVTTVTKALYGDDVAIFAGYILPSQIVSGAFLGWVADRTRTLPLCYGIAVFESIVVVIMLFTPTTGLLYTAMVFNTLAGSFIYTSKFTYIAEIYPTPNHGKLVGYIGLVGGAVCLIVSPFPRAKHAAAWFSTFLALNVVSIGLLIILTIRQRMGIHYLNSVDGQVSSKEKFIASPKEQSFATDAFIKPVPV